MNTILVEVSVGELLDKISILEIKKEKIKDSEKLKFINDEYRVLKDQLDKNVKSDKKLEEFFNNLKKTNINYGQLRMTKECVKKILILEKNLLNFQEKYTF